MTAAAPGQLQFFATVPRGFADLLATELAGFGAGGIREARGGVQFTGSLEAGYRACLGSRLASRVLLQVGQGRVDGAQDFYDFVRSVDWRAHLDARGTLACDYTGNHAAFNNTHFAALRLKDAICDQLREATGHRPSVQTQRPQLRVHAHAWRGEVTLLLDLAGESLGRRGYRLDGGDAPLRENLAAGVLMRSGWPAIAAAGGPLIDPMCGSGTFVIEAAWMAMQVAPGLLRDYWGFDGWLGHDAALWTRLRGEAQAQRMAQPPVALRGSDRNRSVIATARANARRAGLDGLVDFEVADLRALAPPQAGDAPAGLVCVNPPYGERLGNDVEAAEAHQLVGEVLRGPFASWHGAVLTGAPALGHLIGCEASRTHTLWNGAIECRLLRFAPGQRRVRRESRGVVIDDPAIAQSAGARMFANRLGKNLRHLGRQARRQGVGCWRLYDADMPEYALAVDLYTGAGPDAGRRWLYVQEYAPPASVTPQAARRRREEALSVLPEVTGIAFEDVRLRVRRRQKGDSQYRRRRDSGEFHVVEEDGLQLQVNLDDYLDTGLFLDHRSTRARLRAMAAGKRFLNLFCYTGVATVHAVAGGAASSLSIDLSRTYLDWTARNLALNGLGGGRHELLQADCLQWLAAPAQAQFDLIFLDPPTFSNSARMEGVLDVQRDHARLVDGCMARLAPQGLLVFSTNDRHFQLDTALQSRHGVRDITAATLPFDFAGNARIHRCFEIRHAAAVADGA